MLEDEELHKIIDFLTEQASPEFHPQLMKIKPKGLTEGGDRDPLFDEAVKIVLETRRGSVSLLQRRLTVGYSEHPGLSTDGDAGIVGEFKGSQAREVIMDMEDWNALRAAVSQEVANAGFAADDENFGTEPVDDYSASLVNNFGDDDGNETEDSADSAEDSQQSPHWAESADSSSDSDDEESDDDDEDDDEEGEYEEEDSEEVDDEEEYEEEEYEDEDGDDEVDDEEGEEEGEDEEEEYEEDDDGEEDEDVEYEYEYVEVDDDELEDDEDGDEEEEDDEEEDT